MKQKVIYEDISKKSNGEEQGEFRKRRGCMGLVFCIKTDVREVYGEDGGLVS